MTRAHNGTNHDPSTCFSCSNAPRVLFLACAVAVFQGCASPGDPGARLWTDSLGEHAMVKAPDAIAPAGPGNPGNPGNPGSTGNTEPRGITPPGGPQDTGRAGRAAKPSTNPEEKKENPPGSTSPSTPPGPNRHTPQDKPAPGAAPKKPTPDASSPSSSQDPGSADARPEHDEGVMVITASRVREDAFNVPRTMVVVDDKQIRERDPGSIVDTLDDRIGVWVEKRTSTTSDPVVRGLSGSNLVALIDSNTLSTFWGEGGFAADDMYGKIDADSIERVEVVLGPASVQYGSNALGGVLNFITKSSPIDYTEKDFRIGGRAKGTYGSAADEARYRFEAFGANPWMKYIVGWSRRIIHDVEGGRGEGLLEPSGGKDCNVDSKFQFKTTSNSELTLSVQDVHRNPTYRFYRTNEYNKNFRQGCSLTWQVQHPTEFWQQVRANLYYQYKEDRRYHEDTANPAQSWAGVARWRTLTGDVQAITEIHRTNRLTYGLSYHRDLGESPDDEQFTQRFPDGSKVKAAPDTTWDNVGLYVMDRWNVTEKLAFTAGLRYDYFRFAARPDEYYTPPGGFPELDDFTDRRHVFTGGLGAIYDVTREARIYADYQHGFRQFAPRFGVTPHAWGVVMPNGLLDPVTADNFELGTRYRGRKWAGHLAAYYSNFQNFQSVVPGTYNGQSWYDLNGNHQPDLPDENVYVYTGDGHAYIYGVEVSVDLYPGEIVPEIFGPQWTVSGGFMWNYGKEWTRNQNDERVVMPIRHTHPARGLFKLRWDDVDPKRGLWWEFVADFVRHYDRLGKPDDRGYWVDPRDPNSGFIRDDGLPGYTVLDLRGGFNVTEYATITLAVENLTDRKYRSAHSRMDAAGINFQASLDVHFF